MDHSIPNNMEVVITIALMHFLLLRIDVCVHVHNWPPISFSDCLSTTYEKARRSSELCKILHSNEPQNRIAPNLIIRANRVWQDTLIQFNWRYLDFKGKSKLLTLLKSEIQLDIPNWMVKSLRCVRVFFLKHFTYVNSTLLTAFGDMF